MHRIPAQLFPFDVNDAARPEALLAEKFYPKGRFTGLIASHDRVACFHAAFVQLRRLTSQGGCTGVRLAWLTCTRAYSASFGGTNPA